MNGATNEPLVINNIPANIAKATSIGNNQYFFRNLKKFQILIKKFIYSN
tara:strand:- start:83 stop:229 length:147 start_codon:yes stop_codon:yes gene_type:complete